MPNKKNQELNQTGRIIDAVPLTKIPLSRNQSFSYLSETDLPVGSLVSVHLSQRNVEAITVGVKKDFVCEGKIELKPIKAVLEPGFLDSQQLALAEYMSDYYLSPLGIVLKSFVPKRVRMKKEIPNQKAVIADQGYQITLTKEQKKAVNAVNSGRYLLFGPAASGKTEVYIHTILKLRTKRPDEQCLILVPEQTLTPQALDRYSGYFDTREIVVLSSNISKSQYYADWQKIKSGQAKIILGTRMAIFAPFKRLGLIVIDEEQDMSYKQWDMNPRYDARTCAEQLSKIHSCPIILGSATPRLESYFRAKKKELHLLELPVLDVEEIKKHDQSSNKKKIAMKVLTAMPIFYEVVDMRKERWEKNHSPISKKLKAEIRYALNHKQQTILFINRQGMSSFSICNKCKSVLKCPHCERALVYDNKSIYRCLHCAYVSSALPECSVCHSPDFTNIGLGTQKIEKEIGQFFPSARIARLDSQVVRTAGAHERVYRDFSEKKIDILVGTQMATKGWDLPSVALVGIIDTDNLLTMPDYSAQEKFYQHIVQLSGRVSRPGAQYPGMVILQTFQPQNAWLKAAVERNFETFFEMESKERESAALPPFGKLIKLLFQDASYKKAEDSAIQVYKKIAGLSEIKVSEPQEAFIPKLRGKYRRQIIIKYTDECPLQLRESLKQLGHGWIIDVDPISMI